uniref:Uncharacterized protein n=1 Tax=Anguilla anguilla TaxID=7936 RepID=A0A0E9WQ74_ANGAN
MLLFVCLCFRFRFFLLVGKVHYCRESRSWKALLLTPFWLQPPVIPVFRNWLYVLLYTYGFMNLYAFKVTHFQYLAVRRLSLGQRLENPGSESQSPPRYFVPVSWIC